MSPPSSLLVQAADDDARTRDWCTSSRVNRGWLSGSVRHRFLPFAIRAGLIALTVAGVVAPLKSHGRLVRGRHDARPSFRSGSSPACDWAQRPRASLICSARGSTGCAGCRVVARGMPSPLPIPRSPLGDSRKLTSSARSPYALDRSACDLARQASDVVARSRRCTRANVAVRRARVRAFSTRRTRSR